MQPDVDIMRWWSQNSCLNLSLYMKWCRHTKRAYLREIGPCTSSIEMTVWSWKIQHQSYHKKQNPASYSPCCQLLLPSILPPILTQRWDVFHLSYTSVTFRTGSFDIASSIDILLRTSFILLRLTDHYAGATKCQQPSARFYKRPECLALQGHHYIIAMNAAFFSNLFFW